jgi:anhydro-N-acetylmuramic acid kinase
VALYAGLISGTSMDGVEAVMIDIAPPRFEIRGAVHVDYPPALATRLHAAVANPTTCNIDEMGALDAAIGEVFADAARKLLQFTGFSAADVRAIGSHGQTLLHRPRAELPFTLQIGDANRIAERTGIDVVADFRRRDMAAGGEAAPLVPAFHAAVFSKVGECRVVVNIGGIGNITVLDADGTIGGFDTGPGNCLMDLWTQEHLGEPFDRDGAWAASATPDAALLERMLQEPYLQRRPPKSTGRELFNHEWLSLRLPGVSLPTAVVQATLCEFTARTIAESLSRFSRSLPAEVLVCGGGTYNSELMRRLAAQLPTTKVMSTAARGIAPEHVEAAAFAWFAYQFLEGQAGNVVSVTGARGPRILGALHRGCMASAQQIRNN